MKTLMRNVVKALIFVLTLTLINCQKEDVTIEINQVTLEKPLYQEQMVSLSEIPIIKKSFLSITGESSQSRIDNVNEAIFDYDNILEVIDTLNNINYSFNFRYADTPLGEFYNLVIGKTPTGETTTPYVLKYECDDSHLEQFIVNDFNSTFFKGTIALHKYTDFFQEGYFSRIGETLCPPDLDEVGDPIPCETQPVDGGGSGGGGAIGDGPTGDAGSSSGSGIGGGDGTSGTIAIVCACVGHSEAEIMNGDCTCDTIEIIIISGTGGNNNRTSNPKAGAGADECPDCNVSSPGGIGINPISIETMRSTLKNNLTLSTAGIGYIGDPDNSVEVSIVYSFIEPYIEFNVDINPEVKAFAEYAIEVLAINPNANPLLGADCRSFEYAQPPGALQKGCAVSDFNHTFYTAGIRPNGSPYIGEIVSNISIIYFTMPTWMTNGQAANLTARAVTNAIKAADLYFFENPDVSRFELGDVFRDALRAQLAIVGGGMSTTIEPFPIPSPAPYITSVLGISNPYDCE